MEKALFGRMSLGECIEMDHGHLGCSADALKHLDSVCSNTKSCEMVVSGIDIPVETLCPKDFTSYLDASFACTRGMNGTLSSIRNTVIIRYKKHLIY